MQQAKTETTPARHATSSALLAPVVEGLGSVAGFVATAPTRLPVVRTLLKEGIKLGLRTGHAVQSLAVEQRRQWGGLMAEAAAESQAEAEEEEAAKTAQEDDERLKDAAGPDMARLLRSAGVRSTRSLARRKAATLHKKLVEVNEREDIVSKVPSVAQIQHLIDSV